MPANKPLDSYEGSPASEGDEGVDALHEGHGWWPYVVPYASFLLMTEFGGRLPEGAAPFVLAIKPAIVLGLILWFRARGAYPEWRGEGAAVGLAGGVMDVLVGLALTVVWVVPFLLIPDLRPEPGGEFDPSMAGERFVALILGMDRLLDMFRTMINVTGDLTVTSVMAVSEGEVLRPLASDRDEGDPDRGFEHRLEREQRSVKPGE